MDRVFWKPGWRESPDDEFFAQIDEITARPRWVLDGNYSRTLPIKWKNVQQVIWLDTSFPRTLWRVTSRTIRRALAREELWPGTGNRESLAQAFLSRKSIIWWSIRQHPSDREKYPRLMVSPDYAHISFVRLRTPAEVRHFLETV
jgi:hypothetical protein